MSRASVFAASVVGASVVGASLLVVPLAAGPASGASPAATGALAHAARTVSCATVTVRVLDAELGIDAVAVHSVRPRSPKGSLICSYFGATGHAANQATIVYLHANAAELSAIRAGVSRAHRVSTVAHLGSAAFSYVAAPEHYLYLLSGSYLVELYAAVPAPKVERLARGLLPRLA
ncbi:MAG: hypothetical protein M0Z33_02255 [Actinomycetota bacterium]|nr:hypothetical protein [Actinomycetota bacterium]